MRRFMHRKLVALQRWLETIATNDLYDVAVIGMLGIMMSERRRRAGETGQPVVYPTVRAVVEEANRALRRAGNRGVRTKRGLAAVTRLALRKQLKYLDATPEFDAFRGSPGLWSPRTWRLIFGHLRRSPDLRIDFVSYTTN